MLMCREGVEGRQRLRAQALAGRGVMSIVGTAMSGTPFSLKFRRSLKAALIKNNLDPQPVWVSPPAPAGMRPTPRTPHHAPHTTHPTPRTPHHAPHPRLQARAENIDNDNLLTLLEDLETVVTAAARDDTLDELVASLGLQKRAAPCTDRIGAYTMPAGTYKDQMNRVRRVYEPEFVDKNSPPGDVDRDVMTVWDLGVPISAPVGIQILQRTPIIMYLPAVSRPLPAVSRPLPAVSRPLPAVSRPLPAVTAAWPLPARRCAPSGPRTPSCPRCRCTSSAPCTAWSACFAACCSCCSPSSGPACPSAWCARA
jgi:hypothetical protein